MYIPPLFDRDHDFLITFGILGAVCSDFTDILEKIFMNFQVGPKIHLSIAQDSSRVGPTHDFEMILRQSSMASPMVKITPNDRKINFSSQNTGEPTHDT